MTNEKTAAYHCSAKNPGGNAKSKRFREIGFIFRDVCKLNSSRPFSSRRFLFSTYFSYSSFSPPYFSSAKDFFWLVGGSGCIEVKS